jgi:energy-coupling factor transporter transmembrane protein EcfT
MSVDTTPDQHERASGEPATSAPPKAVPAGQEQPKPALVERLGLNFAHVEWRVTLLVAALMALCWCLFFLGPSVLQIVAGIVPVMAGLYLGRRVQRDWLAHGLALGGVGFGIGLLIIFAYGALGQAGLVPLPSLQLAPNEPPSAASVQELIFFYTTYSLFALIPFPAFGTVMAGRAEQRNRQLREEIAERGGRLERPGVIRTVEDLRGLSLPQLGSYVANLYRKKGFEFKDYRFIDKDKHLDLEFDYEGERYLLRLTVADKVTPGTIQSLVQDMKRRSISKGVAITSTEFTADAVRTAAGRRNLLAIDGPTLFAMAEG